MKHPISGTSLLLYILFWVIIIIGHATLLYEVNGFSLKYSLLDTTTYYTLLAAFGMSFFYVVRYLSKPLHFLGIIVVVTGMTVLHDQLLIRFINLPAYETYLDFTLIWRISSGILLLSLLLLLYFLAIRNRSMKEEMDKQDKLKALLRQTEMEMLRFQINPHFIFNSLNSISALTMTSPESAQEMIIKLSDFFRKALGTEKDDVHTVEEEMNQVDRYLDIERIRFGDRLKLKKEIDPTCLTSRVPAMILQPIFENAVKHGVYENLDTVTITTTISCRKGMMKITVSNTYDPIQNGKRNGSGIGLKNVRSRLELMYDIPDLVTIERTKTEYKIHLLIPQP